MEFGGGKEGKGGRNLRWRSERERKVMGAKCKVEIWRGKFKVEVGREKEGKGGR